MHLPLPSRTLYIVEGNTVQRNQKKQIQASRERHIRPLSAHRNVCSVDLMISQPIYEDFLRVWPQTVK